MRLRLAACLVAVAVAVAVAGALAVAWAAAPAAATRSFFQLTAGSTAGSYFAVGEAIAGIASHPHGLPRCDGGACGPPGLIVSVRTSDGASANILAVEQGLSDSGLTHGATLTEALKGVGIFRKTGKASHVRLIASLYDEPVQLVAAKASKIASIRDLAGKRVSQGDAESGSDSVVRAVLAAYRVSSRRIRRQSLPVDRAALALRQGKIDAFFYIGAAPTPLIRDLLAQGAAILVPLDGTGRTRAIQRLAGFKPVTLPAGTYPRMKPLPTLSGRALWVARDSVPADLVQALLTALYHPANRAALAATSPLRRLALSEALSGSAAPVHPGAERYYRRVGLIKPSEKPPAKAPAQRR